MKSTLAKILGRSLWCARVLRQVPIHLRNKPKLTLRDLESRDQAGNLLSASLSSAAIGNAYLGIDFSPNLLGATESPLWSSSASLESAESFDYSETAGTSFGQNSDFVESEDQSDTGRTNRNAASSEDDVGDFGINFDSFSFDSGIAIAGAENDTGGAEQFASSSSSAGIADDGHASPAADSNSPGNLADDSGSLPVSTSATSSTGLQSSHPAVSRNNSRNPSPL